VKFSEINCAACCIHIMRIPSTRTLGWRTSIACAKSLLVWLGHTCIGPEKRVFSQYLFPEVNFPQITLATEYLYIIPISRNLLFVFWLEIACARSFPKRRGKNWPWKKSYFFFNKWANKPLWPEQVDPHGTSMLWLGRVFYLGWFGPKLVSHGSLKDGKTAPNWCLCCFWCFQPP